MRLMQSPPFNLQKLCLLAQIVMLSYAIETALSQVWFAVYSTLPHFIEENDGYLGQYIKNKQFYECHSLYGTH